MKKIFLLLFFCPAIYGQSVVTLPYGGISIGDNTAPSTSLLQIKMPSSAKMEFMGLNPYFTFYQDNNFVGYFQAISNTFEIGTKNSANITFETSGARNTYFQGSTGRLFTQYIGVNFQGGLRVAGPFRVDTGNSGVLGQVLRSRGNGNEPQWSDFSYDPQIGFSAIRNTNLTLTGFASTNINDLTITFQDTPSTGIATNGVYTAPSAGFYHFDVNVPFFEWTGNANGSIGVEIYKNGIIQNTCYNRFGSFGMSIQQDGTKCGYDLKLAANDAVDFRIYMNSNIPANVNIPTTFLSSNQRLTVSGYKVY